MFSRPVRRGVEAVEKPLARIFENTQKKLGPLRGIRTNDLGAAKGKVTQESLHSGAQNSFSTVSLGK